MRATVLTVCLLLVALALPSALLAQEAPPPDDRVTLRLAVRDPNITAVYQMSQRKIFEEYVRTYKDTVKIETSEGLQMQNVGNEGGLLAIAGGISPDVFTIYYQQMHSYIEQGFVTPIDDYLDTWEKEEEVPDQLWPVVIGKDKDGVEHRYGAIYTWPTLYLVYRKDLFREVGLDPNHPPENWEELFEYSKLLSDPERKVETAGDRYSSYGRMGFFLSTSGSWWFSNFVWQGGGDVVGKREEDGKWMATFDGPGGVKALEFYKRMRWEKWSRAGKEYTGVIRTGIGGSAQATYQRTFSRGEVAMTFMPLRTLQTVLEENIVRLDDIGVAPLPAGPTGIRASIVDGDVWCISSRIAGDKKKMDAAWEYIRFVTSDRAHEIETRIYVEGGYARFVRNPYWLKQFGFDEYFDEVDPQLLAAFDDALTYGRPEPYCPGYAAMAVDMDIPVSKILRVEDTDPEAELKKTVKRINTFFFKLYPEDEMRFKRRISVAMAVIFAGALAFAAYMLVKSLSKRVASARSGLAVALKASRWKHIYAWLFLLPAVGTIFVWSYLPLVRGSVMSFYDYKILADSVFIGLDNFIEAVGQPIFWRALYHTFFYTALTMTFGFATPIILALFLSEVPRFRITFRVLFYLPALTSALVLMFLWKDLLYNPTEYGILNQVIGWFGIAPQQWLQDTRLAMACIVLPGVWAGAGPGSIIYLAALKTVPEELYEASEIDGAGPIAKIRLVTLPFLKGLVIINFFGAFIGSFHATQNIFVMTMGGPEKATHTLSLEIFFNAFLYLKFGYATAMAWIMGAMLIGFTLYQLRIFQRLTFTAGAAREAKQQP